MDTLSNETTNLDVRHDQPSIMAGLVSETEYGRQLGKSSRTCQRDRQRGAAPPHVQVGRRIFYRIDAVRDWLVQRERSTSADPIGGRWRKPRRRMGRR
jgi:hypothetical protein